MGNLQVRFCGGIEVLRMVEYCGTIDTERQEKQRKQIKLKIRKYNMSTPQIKKNVLIIFIDGLQYDVAISSLDLLKSSICSRMIPGIGFSNNIYPEMMCGQTPDEIGYFNEWSPHKEETKKLNIAIRALDITRKSIYINAGIRKIILKKFFKRDYANIPFKYVHLFKPQGSHNFRDLNNKSILREYDFDIVDAVETGQNMGRRDAFAIKTAHDQIRENSMLISLIDLDNIAHVYGIDSERYLSHIAYLDDELKKLIDAYRRKNRNSDIYLLSDHGMARVSTIVNIDIEKAICPMNIKKYLYFIDSTYIRVWIKEKSLESIIKEYFTYIKSGTMLSDEERTKFGISNKDYGDIIFRANEGVIFLPNFYGSRPVNAMHGYDSKLTSQHAIFSIVKPQKTIENLPMSSKQVYRFLKGSLNEK